MLDKGISTAAPEAQPEANDVTLTRVNDHELRVSLIEEGKTYEARMYVFDRETIAELRSHIPAPSEYTAPAGTPERKGMRFFTVLTLFLSLLGK